MYFCQIMTHERSTIMLKRSTIMLIGGLFILISLVGCQRKDKYTALLLRADSIMHARPDSALCLLNSITNPRKMRAADRALYSLLITQAEHKNWILHTNDSLIQVAVAYYKNGKDKEREAKAYYYLGCVYEEVGDIVDATEAYLKALSIKPQKTGDAEMLSMIYESLAECYRSQGFYDKAMEMYRTSYKINIEKNDIKKNRYSLQGISEIFMHKNQWDSAAYYCNKVINISSALDDSSWISASYNNLAHIYYNQEKYKAAYQAVSKSILQKPNDKESINSNYLLLADILSKLGQKDSARYYLSLCEPDGDISLQAAINLVSYEVEKSCGNYKDAIQYIDNFSTLDDSIQSKKRNKIIAELINKHEKEKYIKEISENKKRHNRILIFSCTSLISICVFIILMIDRHRKKEYIALQNSLMKNRGETLKLQEDINNFEIGKSKKTEGEKENKQDALKQLQKEKFHYSIQLFQKTSYYKIVEGLKHKRAIKEKVFTLEERELLWDCIYQIFSDTMSDLKAQCPELTREDLLYCTFYLLGYSNPIIIECTGTNPNALKSRKNRLKNKMNQELYEQIFNNRK